MAPPPSVGWFTHLARCSRDTLQHWITGWCFEPESHRFEIRGGEESGGKMMATLSLTGTVTSWQQTVGMRRTRTIECRSASFCLFYSVGVKCSCKSNYIEHVVADIICFVISKLR